MALEAGDAKDGTGLAGLMAQYMTEYTGMEMREGDSAKAINAQALAIVEYFRGSDAITATSSGVAASVLTAVTEITTNGDSDLDNVTLADGLEGQTKFFSVVAVGNVADSVKITPANMIGGTQIAFAASPLGLGCSMYFASSAGGWAVIGNNGGIIT